jgi:hypothetical protein
VGLNAVRHDGAASFTSISRICGWAMQAMKLTTTTCSGQVVPKVTHSQSTTARSMPDASMSP